MTSTNKLEIIVIIDDVSYYMDTYDDISIPLNYQISDINDIATRRSSYSLSITVPETSNNRYIFNSVSDLSVDLTTFNPNLKSPCQILFNSVPVFVGNLQLISIEADLDNGEIKYNCIVYSENDDFFKTIGDSLLSDLDFSELNHDWTAANMTASWIEPWNYGYFYPMIDTQGLQHINYINGSFTMSHMALSGVTGSVPAQLFISDFQPSTYIKYIWNKIFTTAGYNYTSNFLNSDIFENIHMPFASKALKQDPDFIETLKFIVGKTSNQVIATQSFGNLNIQPPNINIIGERGFYNYSAISFTDFTTPFNNLYNLWDGTQSMFIQPTTPSNERFKLGLNINYYTPGPNTVTYQLTPPPPGDYIINTPTTTFELETEISIVMVRSMDDSGATVSGWSATPTLTDLLSFPRIPFAGNAYQYNLLYDDPTVISQGGSSQTTIIGTNSVGDFLNNTKLVLYTEPLDNRPTYNNGFFGNLSYRQLRPGEQVRVFLVNYGRLVLLPNAWFYTPFTDLTPFGKTGSAFGAWGDVTILEDDTYISNEISTTIVPGQPINYNQIMPVNVKQKDFLTSIIKMFNLYIEPNSLYPSTLNIEPRNDYYDAGSFKDWSAKLDISKPIQEQILAETQNRSTLFTYKEDTDYYNQDYHNRLKRTYGDVRYSIDNDFIDGEKVIDNIFSPTPMSKLEGSNGLVYPSIFKLNNGKVQASDSSTNGNYSNYRILFKSPDGLIGLSQSDNWIFEGTTMSSYPYCGHFYPDPYNPSDDLNWGQSYLYYKDMVPTNNNLFNNYWRRTMDEISDINSRVVTAEFYLTPEDIYNFRFNDNIYLTINGVGGYYKVNKITNYDPTQIKTTTVELLKTIFITVPILEGTNNPTYSSIHLDSTGLETSTRNITLSGKGNHITGVGHINSGIFNTIGGSGTVTTGNGNVVSIKNGLTVGDNNIHTNIASGFILGDNNTSIGGSQKMIIGDNNIDSGNTNMVIGNSNSISKRSQGNNVFGSNNALDGDFGTISYSINNTNVFGVGNTVSTSTNFIAGSNNLVSGSSSNVYIFGDNVVATYSGSMIINVPVIFGPSSSLSGIPNTLAYFDADGALNGIGTVLGSPIFSLAEGPSGANIASGFSSHAEGLSTTANGQYSHSEGDGTYAGGDASHAEGVLTNAVGYASHAGGQGAQSSNYAEWSRSSDNITGSVGSFQYGIVSFIGYNLTLVQNVSQSIFLDGNSTTFNIPNNTIYSLDISLLVVDLSLITHMTSESYNNPVTVINNAGTLILRDSSNTTQTSITLSPFNTFSGLDVTFSTSGTDLVCSLKHATLIFPNNINIIVTCKYNKVSI